MKKAILLVNLSLVILGGMVWAPPFVYADDNLGLSQVAGAAKLDTVKSVPGALGQVLGAVLALVGIMFFLLMLYGGITWMTAHGNEEQASKALKTLMSAIAGLIIVLASYTLVKFVFGSVKGEQTSVSIERSAPDVVRAHKDAGKKCKVNSDCTVGSGLTCTNGKCFGDCQATFGNLGYQCLTQSSCTTGKSIRFYCPGTDNNTVCCKPAASFSPPSTGGGGCIDRVDRCGGISDINECTIDIDTNCVWDKRINSCTWAGGDCSILDLSECKGHSYCEPGTLSTTCGKAGIPGVCIGASGCIVTSPATCPSRQVCCLRRKILTPGS